MYVLPMTMCTSSHLIFMIVIFVYVYLVMIICAVQVALVSDDIEPAWDRGLRQGVVFITGAMRSDETARGSRQCEEFLVSAELLPTTGQFNVSVK